ncbi:hypothetical protein [Rhizobium ruizarguesonis]|uniref:hypothetical protein n=1 Tax=Rhizobium ruizarguesonis TaxID=2081791 RepID=UPI0010312D3B|nr:hypothetical protein [Rhizobium ruizarguesonis]TBA63939.1 hypothetical protein ELH57_09705 [Rhizobium ruizarguesonis]
MDEEQVEAIIEERLKAALLDLKQSTVQMMPIRPFKAWDDADKECEVVGVVHQDEDLQFIAIVERGGECFPTMLDVVYRTPAPASES